MRRASSTWPIQEFLFPFLILDFKYGNREKAFENSNSVVLTNENGKKYFGDTNPLVAP